MHKVLFKNLVPILLGLIAISQIYMVFKKNLTPWKGGGFGMFAMIDRLENRPVHITLISSEKEYIVDARDLLDRQEYYRVKSRPDRKILERLATNVLNRKWLYQPDDNQLTDLSLVKPYNDPDLELIQNIITADSVVIEVYSLRMNIENNEMTLKRIAHLKRMNNFTNF
jgi:hypothetical protein